ncbi:MarR family transcriptional regulator [Catellatospora paridis]|uniref:MarR family transcriptional regulator n=1 Tax=Catellatospora paridis TaxID=1617086 RepID=UPI0012D3C268|nr:helix-turn-helix domain-containing protein [Catellatospora paridis]
MKLTERQSLVVDHIHDHAPITAKDLATQTAIAYSSLTPILRGLANLGLIAKNGDSWTIATTDQATDLATMPDGHDGSVEAPSADTTADEPATDPEAESEAGGSATDEPSDTECTGSTDASAETGLGTTADEPIATEPGAPDGDEADEQTTTPAAKRRYNRSDIPALGKGKLREAVAAYLHGVPGEQLTVPQIAAGVGKQLGRAVGNGAVQNAVLKLIELGQAVHLPGKPNKYQAATK